MSVLHPLPWGVISGTTFFLVLEELFSEPVGAVGAVAGALVVGVLVGREWVQQPAGMM